MAPKLTWRVRTSIILAACLSASPGLAAAQESYGRFELTPYAGFRFGGEFDERDGDRDFALDERVRAHRGRRDHGSPRGDQGQESKSGSPPLTSVAARADVSHA
jgi:hypothetical protein